MENWNSFTDTRANQTILIWLTSGCVTFVYMYWHIICLAHLDFVHKGQHLAVKKIRTEYLSIPFFCSLFPGTLDEPCTADTVVAESLQAFDGGHDDPVSVSIEGC